MTILQILEKAAGVPIAKLIELLRAGAAAAPDLATDAEAIIAKLTAVADPVNLAAIGQAVISELGDISQGRLTPTDHPGDGI